MASAISDEEFHRMQLQLIELRTAKYELEALSKKQEREIHVLKESAESTDKELQKAQKAISKSKKAKEVESLYQENDSLQMKLESQEEDFRVQNQTLMQELNKLVSSNEDLEKQVSELKVTPTTRSTSNHSDTNDLEDEVRRLQAQNTALQKSVTTLQSKYETNIEAGDLGSHGNHEDADVTQTNGALDADLSKENSENLARTIDELRLNLDTELEEKRILKQDLNGREEKYSREVKSLKEELEKISEKLKKKQESYLHLQEEKESYFKENSAKLVELQSSKDRDHKYYNDQISKLQQEIVKYQRLQEDIKTNSDQTVKQLQGKMAHMQQQLDAANIIESQHLSEKSKKYESQVKDLQTQILTLTQKRDDLTAQLQECQRASSVTNDQLCSLQEDRDRQIQALQEANRLAEKRKSMLDDLAIKYQKDCDKHREQILGMENSYEAKMKTLQQKLEEEKVNFQKKSSDFEKLVPIVEEQQTKLTSLEESKGWLERRLEETEGSLDKTLDENETTLVSLKADHEEEITSLTTEHSKHIEELQTTFQEQIQKLTTENESQNKTIQTLEVEVVKLKQDLKDGINEKKVHEKKGKSVLKDLKKQLHAERKRGEKIQERLQEVLSTGSHNKSIEDLFGNRSLDMGESWREDQSSISSWSGGGTLASYGTSQSIHSALSTSPQSSPLSPSNELPPNVKKDETLENDNMELLSRMAHIQQEKWDLEEKVRHLETSTAAMANDLIEKAKIISHYVMESRTDTKAHISPGEEKITLKKVLDMVNKGDDMQGLKEMNKKLQNMLEETLTKNMHLQKDLETLSQEIVRLSKLPHQNQSMSNHKQPPDNSSHPNTKQPNIQSTPDKKHSVANHTDSDSKKLEPVNNKNSENTVNHSTGNDTGS